MNNKTFHVISNTHWDREWRFPFQKNRQMLVDMIDSVIEILLTEPGYRAFHLDSQSIVLKDYLEIKPQKIDVIKKLVKDKRLLIGPWYILPDEFQVSGENLIRNLLIGHKICSEHGGVSKIGYSPFSWGQISQLPQIYKQFKIDLIMFYRGVNSIDSPKAEFLWEGADGTRMVTSRFSTMPRYNFYFYIYRPVVHNEAISDVEYKWSRGGMPFHFADKDLYEEDYSIINPIDSYSPENIKPSVHAIIKDQAEDFTTDHVIWMEGHDSSGPNINTVKIINDIKKQLPELNVIHSTLEDYACAVLENVDKAKLKLVKGERRSAQYDRRSGNLYGYTTSARMYLKQKNYETERWIQFYAEPFNVFSSILGRDSNDKYIETAWEYLIQNSAHDSIGGCSLDEIHEDMMNRYRHSIEISKGVFERSVKYILKNINSNIIIRKSGSKSDLFLTALNPNNCSRDEIAEVFIDIPKEFDKGSFCLIDDSGNIIENIILEKQDCQPILEQMIDRPMYFEMVRYKTLLFIKDLPAFGFKQYQIIPQDITKKNGSAKTGKKNAALENEHLKIKINENGSLNITDKKSGIIYRNVGYFVDEGEAGHAWTHESVGKTVDTLNSSPEISKVEDNSLRTVYSVRHKIKIQKDLKSRKNNSKPLIEIPVNVLIILDKNSNFVQFEIEVMNLAESHRLRFIVPTYPKAQFSYGEGQFDVVKRAVTRPDTSDWIEQPMYDYPMHHFVDVSDGVNGCAVLVNGLKEYEILKDKSNSIAITLFRAFEYIIAPSSIQDYSFKKGSQCLGKHKYRLAFYPHTGDWNIGKVYLEALNFSNGLSLIQTGKSEGKLNPTASFLEIFPKDLVFSALKKSEDGLAGTFILRVYNPTDRKIHGKVKCMFNIQHAEEVTLEEYPVNTILVNSGNSFEIKLDRKKIMTLKLKVDINERSNQ